MVTSIIKELSVTEIAECKEICQTLMMMNMIKAALEYRFRKN